MRRARDTRQPREPILPDALIRGPEQRAREAWEELGELVRGCPHLGARGLLPSRERRQEFVVGCVELYVELFVLRERHIELLRTQGRRRLQALFPEERARRWIEIQDAIRRIHAEAVLLRVIP